MHRRMVFPFSAVVSLDKLKLAILINVINPKIGGILIRGPKGSGKTTVVRGLTDILPKIKVVKGCVFNCNPYDPSNMCTKCNVRYHKREKLSIQEREMTIVNLPLGATEDRVVGSLDVEKAIKLGVEALEPGILAEANQNILYVDEINLLPDHIADDLLDSAATGWNIIEREGISVSHPSRFVFVGTMNPEEGELRPQLLDRFPLSIGVERMSSVSDRIEVVKRNIEFERNPEKFIQKYTEVQEELGNSIARAKDILPKVEMPEKLLEAVCKACLELKVDGMRPDIVISKAACTLAAFEGRTMVTLNDILVASELALSHRTREGGFLEPVTPEEIQKMFIEKVKEVDHKDKSRPNSKPKIKPKEGISKKLGAFFWPKKISEKEKVSPDRRLKKCAKRIRKAIFTLDKSLTGAISSFTKHEAPKEARTLTVGFALKPSHITEGKPLLAKFMGSLLAPFKLFFKTRKPPRGVSTSVGKRAETVTTIHRGRSCGWRFPHGKPRDINLPATIRAAARKQRNRERPVKTVLKICLEDVREKRRLYKAPMTIVFVIDISKSMLFNIEEVKEAILKLHSDAYRFRDKVGIVALKWTEAVIVQHPTTNLRVVANKLLGLRVSGFTPLAAGIMKAWEILKQSRRRDRSTIPVMVVITDGNANVPLLRRLQTGEIRKFDPLGLALFEYEDLAVEDVMSVSKMIRKEGIHTVVVNTNPAIEGPHDSGYLVTKMIASITNGSHHELGGVRSKEGLIEKMFEGIAEDQRVITHKVSLSLKSP